MTSLLAERYKNNKWHEFQKQQTKTFISLLERKKYNEVCDVGCGKGYWDYLLLKDNLVTNKLVGCDIYNDFQINELKTINPKLQIAYNTISDNGRLPEDDNGSDLVFSMDVIEHVEDYIFFLNEHIRIAKSGGTIIIGTPNYWRLTNIFLKSIGRLNYPRKMGTDTYGDVIHIREFRKKELLEILSKCNNVNKKTIEIVPCWYGVTQLNVGFAVLPKFCENLCQFWFLKFEKK